MATTSECRHEDFEAWVEVNRFEDTGRFMADVRVHCKECMLPFRFIGLPVGMLWENPAMSVDGCEARLPIEPETEKRIMGGGRYEMPRVELPN